MLPFIYCVNSLFKENINELLVTFTNEPTEIISYSAFALTSSPHSSWPPTKPLATVGVTCCFDIWTLWNASTNRHSLGNFTLDCFPPASNFRGRIFSAILKVLALLKGWSSDLDNGHWLVISRLGFKWKYFTIAAFMLLSFANIPFHIW